MFSHPGAKTPLNDQVVALFLLRLSADYLKQEHKHTVKECVCGITGTDTVFQQPIKTHTVLSIDQ